MTQNRSHAVMAQRHEAHDIVLRAEAILLGQKWYFTGCACPRGHIAKRSVSNRDCRSCVDARTAARRLKNPESARAKDRVKYHAAGDRKREQMRHRDPVTRRAYDKARYDGEAERRRAYANWWWRENRDRHYAHCYQQKARIKRATPAWLTPEQREEMTALYIAARNLPGEWHVDHIGPLCGKASCGLHVPWNLQIITGDANRRKGNAL